MAEKLSVVMARKSLERADVAFVVLDAEQGIAALDAAIAGYAVEAGCSIILVLNKWDTLENKTDRIGARLRTQDPRPDEVSQLGGGRYYFGPDGTARAEAFAAGDARQQSSAAGAFQLRV